MADSKVEEQSEALMRMDEVCSRVASAAREILARGEPLNIREVFEGVIETMGCDQDELVRLWSMLMLGSMATKRVARRQWGLAQETSEWPPLYMD